MLRDASMRAFCLPIGYGSEGPHCLPSALCGYFVFSRNGTALLCLCITVSFKKMYAMPPLNTTHSGKLPGTTPPHLMQCFVATVRRRHPPETIPKPCVPKSPSLLSSCCVLDSVVAAVFLCDGRWRRSWRGGRGLRRSQSSGGPTSGQPRSHSQALPTTPRPFPNTNSRTGHRLPHRCACGLTLPRLALLAFGCAGR